LKKKIKYPVPIERKNLSPIIEPKKSKYRNKKIIIDEITFDSTKEGKRYLELKQKEKQGEITNLRLQVKFELQPSFKINGKTVRAINYVCDFYYYDNQTQKFVIEDVKASKNFQTDVYKLKKKLFEYKYKIEIKEIY
jgi:hypothetical protein